MAKLEEFKFQVSFYFRPKTKITNLTKAGGK